MALTDEQREVLGQISAEDGFRYFAGDGDNSHYRHTTIYAGNDGDGKHYVVGVSRDANPILVECDTFDDAVVEYKKCWGGREGI